MPATTLFFDLDGTVSNNFDGIARCLKRVAEKCVPEFLWRSVPDEAALAQLPEDQRFPVAAKDISRMRETMRLQAHR